MEWRKLITLFGAVVFLPVFFVFIPTKEWIAVLLILFSFFLLFSSRYIRRDSRVFVGAVFVLAIRHGVSISNAFFTTIYGAGLDATTFHLKALEIARSTQPTWFSEFGSVDVGSSLYARCLGFCYRYMGESLLLGQSLSVLAYVVSAILIIRVISSLRLTRWKRGVILLYGGLPPAIIYESITMREAWEALFFIAVCYFAMRLRRQITVWRIVAIIGFGGALGFLHNGLLVYALFLICYSLFWGSRVNLTKWRANNIISQFMIIPLLIGIALAWWNLAGDMGGASQALVKGETANYYETYREKGEQDARANYEVKLDTSSIPRALWTGSFAFIYYLFAPFPWQISSFIDLYAFCEGVLRFLLLYYGIKTWWYSSGERKSIYGYLLVCTISLELLWSFGTTNWGTAIRHHIVAYGLLIIVGGPGLNLRVNLFLKRLLKKNRHRTGRVRHSLPMFVNRFRPLSSSVTLPPSVSDTPGKDF